MVCPRGVNVMDNDLTPHERRLLCLENLVYLLSEEGQKAWDFEMLPYLFAQYMRESGWIHPSDSLTDAELEQRGAEIIRSLREPKTRR